MTKPSREEVIDSWRAVPATGSVTAALESFALYWYEKGRQRGAEESAEDRCRNPCPQGETMTQQTEREAFELFMYGDTGKIDQQKEVHYHWLTWQAACAYQREKDAVIAGRSA